MTVLSDKDILKLIKAKRINITPFDRKKVSGSSVDLRISDAFLIFKHSELEVIDPLKKHNSDITDKIKVKKGKFFVIYVCVHDSIWYLTLNGVPSLDCVFLFLFCLLECDHQTHTHTHTHAHTNPSNIRNLISHNHQTS